MSLWLVRGADADFQMRMDEETIDEIEVGAIIEIRTETIDQVRKFSAFMNDCC